jgi:hypothetical protein
VGFIARYFFAMKCFFKIWFDRGAAESVKRLLESGSLPEPAQPRTVSEEGERGAARLLAVLQREGRLVDFLQEDIGPASDAQIGAAARRVHGGCAKALGEFVDLVPAMAGDEGARVAVEAGFDASAIRLVGDLQGEPPFRGTLVHHGWRAAAIRLPDLPETMDPMVVAAAEVEV